MSLNRFGWTAILAWAILIVISTMFMGCQQYDYIHEKTPEKELTKVSIDILGTDSIRAGIEAKLPSATFKMDESTLDTESIKELIKELTDADFLKLMELLGAL